MQIIQGKKRPLYSFLTPCTNMKEQMMNIKQKRIAMAPTDCIAEKFKKENMVKVTILFMTRFEFLTIFHISFKVGQIKLGRISSTHHISCIGYYDYWEKLDKKDMNKEWFSSRSNTKTYCGVECNGKCALSNIHVPETGRPTSWYGGHVDVSIKLSYKDIKC